MRGDLEVQILPRFCVLIRDFCSAIFLIECTLAKVEEGSIFSLQIRTQGDL